MHTDILIVGGTTGGVSAALAACALGARVVMVEATDWIGGQLTAQAVPPDENRWVESFGSSASYRRMREGVRAWYRTHRRLTPAALASPALNPGGGWVSRLCAEPRVIHAVLVEMLRPHVESGRLRVLTGLTLAACENDGDFVKSARFVPTPGLQRSDAAHAHTDSHAHGVTIEATFVLDATDLGDVLEHAHVEHAIGAEHANVYGEMHGRMDKTHPMDQQAVSWCFALEHRTGEHHVISRPAAYDFWRSYVPTMRDGSTWTGPLFDWTVPSHNAEGKRRFRLVPWPDEPDAGEWEMWRYRRIVDRAMYATPSDEHPDVALINMVQMDYWQKPLLGVSKTEREAALAGAREQSLCLLYWMQTEAPRHDGGVGYPGLRLRGDELGTRDGFAKACYIREPRRLIARTIMHEGHVGTQQRAREGKNTAAFHWADAPDQLGTCEPFADSVGIGHYLIDLHPSCAGRQSVYVPAAPFRIPMGSLIPKRVRNVLAAGKCLGVSHVVNGATRMHQVEWTIGEAAGTLAAWCVSSGREPQGVHEDAGAVVEVQKRLGAMGVPVRWPWEG